MLHACRDFLADKAPLLKVDPAKLLEPGIERKNGVGRQIATIGDAQAKQVAAIVAGLHSGYRALQLRHRSDEPRSERGEPWIGEVRDPRVAPCLRPVIPY